MKGTQTAYFVNRSKGNLMSKQQFEQLKEQLKLLSNSQLKMLQGQISSQLTPVQSELISDEEMQALAQLFR
ncbi:hypothetical protein VHP8226_03393 [Vibrio hippocampi]|uniref:Uncharacterized protein n=2 Tax=Vibrio hippocampi TaxID=654686 RepID=A0ABM8ZN37_9VIBR|nr:hypothetical protein VHP8226_03393 [Vibrio hippocampi]